MPLVLIPLVELLLLFVGIGAALVAHQHASGLVNWLKNVATNLPIGGILSVNQIVKLDRWISHEIGKATATATRKGVQWLLTLSHYQDVMGYWSVYWPVGLYHAVRHLVEHEIPHAIKASTAPLTHAIDDLKAQARPVTKVIHETAKAAKATAQTVPVTKIYRVAMPHAAEWDWLHRHWKAIEHVVENAYTHAPSLPREVGHAVRVPWGITAKQLRRRIGRVEALLGVTAFAAVMASVLGVTSSCLRRGNINKVARRLCGLDARALEGLLGLLADTFFLANICDTIKLLTTALGFIQPEVTAFITAAETWACYGDREAPPSLGAVTLDLPTASAIALDTV